MNGDVRIRNRHGLDPGVDPTDITAFVTGLTFMPGGDGEFTGTMEAVVETTSEVPEPATLTLFGSGLVAFVAIKWRRNKKKPSLNVLVQIRRKSLCSSTSASSQLGSQPEVGKKRPSMNQSAIFRAC